MEIYTLDSQEAIEFLENDEISREEYEIKAFRNIDALSIDNPRLRVGPGVNYELVTNTEGKEFGLEGSLPAEFNLGYELESVEPYEVLE